MKRCPRCKTNKNYEDFINNTKIIRKTCDRCRFGIKKKISKRDICKLVFRKWYFIFRHRL